ncbi:6-bladed beta-propeller [Rhodohalobacter sp. SW132]|uniref:6-bladed beta-propeller n=1 Tax=Rhodohalobacter sp. SW132 TaxID=2293433 RepID=UPI000E248D81|nr:6-bladed beta-propeller [Rhodohalobacter sp. SW132]REL33358.1 6-bladed beta-propeller [Rhodohalobacter sp. SW132]
MNTQKFIQLSVFLIFVILIGCSEKQESSASPELPEHLKDIENLTLIAAAEGALPDTVELIRETVFESNDEVFMRGYISEMAVDENDRVFIAATIPGTVGVYVFDGDGEFIDKFIREGRGPGEYEAISSMQIVQDTLYIFDGRLQKMGQFSTQEFSHIRDMLLQGNFNNSGDTLMA